uniref:Uncharacterized protein n=1 Tax=Chenopodium quinoa TaxID=63459 RepID=A0A803MQI4_CHEQI
MLNVNLVSTPMECGLKLSKNDPNGEKVNPTLFKSLVGSLRYLTCTRSDILFAVGLGPGMKKSFILDAASRLPMLRSISLDLCDAGEGDFDLPHFAGKYSLSNVKISRCKLQAAKMHVRLPSRRGSEPACAQGNPSTCVEQHRPPEDSRERKNHIKSTLSNDFLSRCGC